MDPVVANSVIALSAMAALFGAVLAIASKVFAVHRDPRVEEIVEALPGANCGACGFPGCSGIRRGRRRGRSVLRRRVRPAASDVAEKVAEILGAEAGEHVPKIAVVHCAGGLSNAVQRARVRRHPRTAARPSSWAASPKACIFGCLSLGHVQGRLPVRRRRDLMTRASSTSTATSARAAATAWTPARSTSSSSWRRT